MENEKSSAEILGGVVIDKGTIRLITDFTDALNIGNKINSKQLELAQKQDLYFTGKDGFSKDVSNAVESGNRAMEKTYRAIMLKIVALITLLTTAVSVILYAMSDSKIHALENIIEQIIRK